MASGPPSPRAARRRLSTPIRWQRGPGTGRLAQPKRRVESRPRDSQLCRTGWLVSYCYTTTDGKQAPNLRLNPGDLLILNLKNDLRDSANSALDRPGHHHAAPAAKGNDDPCMSGLMTATSTNLHFHGLTIPAICHQDDVLHTSIQPGDAPFQYRFRVPADEPPGLYWYHPHIHGFSKVQVLGGASGALIVEGIERANKEVAGLPERVLVIRDRDLMNPSAPPSKSEPVVPKMLIDRDGDAANNGTGFGKPAKDLSVNYVPVPYPDYPPATIKMKPEERQLWRVLNASAITYLNLEIVFNRAPQPLGLVALDGVPLMRMESPAIRSVGKLTLECRPAPAWNSS